MGGSQLPTGAINCLSSHPSSPGPTPCHPHQVTPNNLPCLVESLFQEKQGQRDLRQAQGRMMHGWSAVKRDCTKCLVTNLCGWQKQTIFEWHLLFRVKGKKSEAAGCSHHISYCWLWSLCFCFPDMDTVLPSGRVIVGCSINGLGVWWPRSTYAISSLPIHMISNAWAHMNL